MLGVGGLGEFFFFFFFFEGILRARTFVKNIWIPNQRVSVKLAGSESVTVLMCNLEGLKGN